MRPNFFIAGAPKCGTTAIAAWLATHPQVYFSPIKEPHFFNTDGLRQVKSLRDYEGLFEYAKPHHLAVGEGSTHYLYSREAIPAIERYVDGPRFIVCLRDPVEMVRSLHAQRVVSGREVLGCCEKAWRRQPERRLGFSIPRTVRSDPERLQYAAYCRLGEQLERLYETVPRNRVLPIVLNDIRCDPANEYRKIIDFLGLDSDGRVSFPTVNSARYVRSPHVAVLARLLIESESGYGGRWMARLGGRLRRMNVVPNRGVEMRTEFRRELAEYFRDDVERLEHLLGRRLSEWMSNRYPESEESTRQVRSDNGCI